MFRYLVVFILLFSVACSTKKPQQVYDMPWVLWENGLNVDMKPFLTDLVRQGDVEFGHANYERALTYYQQARIAGVHHSNVESLELRTASALLAKDRANVGLRGLSAFYKKHGQMVNFVRPEAAILFGYLYGRKADFRQSLAWFSQGIRRAQNPRILNRAKKGTLLLLSRLPDADFYKMKEVWRRDVALPVLFMEENNRRLRVGGEVIAFNHNPRFWEDISGQDTRLAQDMVNRLSPEEAVLEKGGVLVLLPLTGRYASYGRAVQNGIKLAVQNNSRVRGLNFTYQDTRGSANRAELICEDLAKTKQYSMIIGPLLYSPSESVANCAKQNGMNMITLTKKSEFDLSEGIYQVGMTMDSQLESLVRSTYKDLGYRNYAIAYPVTREKKEIVEKFKEQLSKYSLEPVFLYPYYKDSVPDFTSMAYDIEGFRPDAIYVADDLNALSKIKSSLGPTVSNKVKFIGTGEWADNKKLSQYRNIARGIIYTTPFLDTSRDRATRSFNSAYKRVYGKNPNFLAAQGYDIATIVISSIKELQPGSDLSRAFERIDSYNGLTGGIHYEPNAGIKRYLRVVEYGRTGPKMIAPPTYR